MNEGEKKAIKHDAERLFWEIENFQAKWPKLDIDQEIDKLRQKLERLLS